MTFHSRRREKQTIEKPVVVCYVDESFWAAIRKRNRILAIKLHRLPRMKCTTIQRARFMANASSPSLCFIWWLGRVENQSADFRFEKTKKTRTSVKRSCRLTLFSCRDSGHNGVVVVVVVVALPKKPRTFNGRNGLQPFVDWPKWKLYKMKVNLFVFG